MHTLPLTTRSLAALLALALPLHAADPGPSAEAEELAAAAAASADHAERAAAEADAAVEEAADAAEEAADTAAAKPDSRASAQAVAEAEESADEAAAAVAAATAASAAAEAADETADAAADVAADAEQAAETADTRTWLFDPGHSYIGFRIQHLGLTEVIGSFRDFSGTILADAAAPTASRVSFTAQVASIDSGVEARDEHLRGNDFFDAANHPELTFASTSFEETDDGYLVIGDLTIKGVTREVRIPLTVAGPVQDRDGRDRMGARGQLTIDRTQFGIDYGVPAVAAEVTIDLQVEVVPE